MARLDTLDIVIIRNPCTGLVEQVPVAMVNAYAPYTSDLRLEEAAQVAAMRDEEAAQNLLLSITWAEHFETVGTDVLAVEPSSPR